MAGKRKQSAKPWVSDPEMDAAMKKLWRANCRLKRMSYLGTPESVIEREIEIVDKYAWQLADLIERRPYTPRVLSVLVCLRNTTARLVMDTIGGASAAPVACEAQTFAAHIEHLIPLLKTDLNRQSVMTPGLKDRRQTIGAGDNT